MNRLDYYINGLEEAKRIVAEAFRAGYLYQEPVLYEDGWLFINMLIRKAEEDLTEFLDLTDDED